MLTDTQEKKARDDAVTALQEALTKTNNGLFDAAITSYLSADGFLQKISSIPVATYRVAIGRLMQEAGRKACRAQVGNGLAEVVASGSAVVCLAVPA